MGAVLDFFNTIEPYLAGAGKVAGSVAANRASGRVVDNSQITQGNQTNINRYRSEQLAKLQAAQLLEDATKDRADRVLTDSKTRAQQAAYGDLLANTQDFKINLPSYMPQIASSGGLRPSAIGPAGRQAGRNLAQQALAAQMSGSDIPDLPNMTGLGTNAPATDPLLSPGGSDKVLSILSDLGLGAGTLEEIRNAQKQSQTAPVSASSIHLPSMGGGVFAPTTQAAPDPTTQGSVAQLLAMKNTGLFAPTTPLRPGG